MEMSGMHLNKLEYVPRTELIELRWVIIKRFRIVLTVWKWTEMVLTEAE